MKKSVLKEMDWFEEIESVNVENKVIDIGEELDESEDQYIIDNDFFDADTFSIGCDW